MDDSCERLLALADIAEASVASESSGEVKGPRMPRKQQMDEGANEGGVIGRDIRPRKKRPV